MRLSSWLRDLGRRFTFRRTVRPARSRLRRRPGRDWGVPAHVEILESRTLLAAVTWTGAGGDLNWNNSANWSGNATPGQQDDVKIGNLGSSTIVVSGTAVDVHSLNTDAAIEVSGTSFKLAASSAVNAAFSVDNGGSLNVSGATVSGTGNIFVAAGSSMVFANGTLDVALTGGGAVDFTNGATIAGTYDITGTTTVDGASSFTGHVLSVGSSLTVNAAANFYSTDLDVNQLVTDDDLTAGNITVADRFAWIGGALRGAGTVTVLNDGSGQPNLVLNTNVGGWTLDGKLLDNQGVAVVSGEGATLTLANGAQFDNSGIVTVSSGSPITVASDGSLGTAFENTGTFVESQPANTAAFFGNPANVPNPVRFDNSGSVVVTGGDLRLTGGGTSTGSFTVAAGAELDLGGQQSLAGTSTITGAGTVVLGIFSNDMATIAGTYDITGTTVVNGTSDFSGAVQAVGTSLTTNATANFHSTNLDVSQLVVSTNLNQVLTAGNITVADHMLWTSGTITGGTLTILNDNSGSPNLVTSNNADGWALDGETLKNEGLAAAEFGGATLALENGAQIDNSGTFTVETSNTFVVASDGSIGTAFENTGTFIEAQPTGTLLDFANPTNAPNPVRFDNSGTVDVIGGDLRLTGGGTSTGSFTVAVGAELDLGGIQDLTGASNGMPASSVTGAGVVDLGVSFATDSATIAGIYDVTGSTVVNGTSDFTGNVASVGSSLTVNAAANFHSTDLNVNQLVADISLDQILTAGNITVADRMLWTSGTITGGTLTILNDGSGSPNLRMSNNADGAALDGETLNNEGQAVAGAFGLTLKNGAQIDNSGMFTVQTSGQLTVASDGSLGTAFENTGTFTESQPANTVAFFGNPANVPNPVRFDNSGTVVVTGGDLRLTGGGTSTGSFTVAAGAELDLGGQYLWEGGTIGGGGTVAVLNDGSGSPGLIIGNAQNWTMDGTLLVNEGAVLIQNTGSANTVGAIHLLNAARIDNSGTFTIDATANVAIASDGGSGTAFENTGTFVVSQGGSAFVGNGASPDNLSGFGTTFDNSGTVTADGNLFLRGGGTSSGSFTVATGAELDLGGNQDLTGPSNGVPGSSVTGAGFVDVGLFGGATIAGTYDVTGSTQVDGASNFSGKVESVGNSLTVNAAANFYSGALQVNQLFVGATFLAGDVTVNDQFEWEQGTIGGAGTLTVLDDGGTAPSLILGPGLAPLNNWTLDGKTIDNQGRAIAENVIGFMHFKSAAQIDNSGTFTIGPTAQIAFISDGTSGEAFDNSGAFNVAGSVGFQNGANGYDYTNAVSFDNSGTVNIAAGDMRLVDTGTSSGSFAVAAGAELDLGGHQDLTGTSCVTGAGFVDVGLFGGGELIEGVYDVTGSTTVDGPSDFTGTVRAVGTSLAVNQSANFHSSALTVNQLFVGATFLAGNVTVNDQFEWEQGTIGGAGTLTALDDGGTVPSLILGPGLAPLNNWTLDGKTIDNQGRAIADNVIGFMHFKNAAQIDNSGTFTIGATAQIAFISDGTSGEAFDNSGAFNVVGSVGFQNGANGYDYANAVAFDDSGTVDVQAGSAAFATFTQTAGDTKLDGGSVSTATPFEITGGVLEGNGQIDGGVNNGATVNPGFPSPPSPSPGVIGLTGNYTQQSSGQLAIAIGGTTPGNQSNQYSQLNVNGTAQLAGALDVTLVNGFVPVGGTSFTIVHTVSGTVNGTFDGLAEGATLSVDGHQFSISYAGGNVTLTAKQLTTTRLTSSTSSSTYGDQVTFTATVTPQISGTATGTVTFYEVDAQGNILSTLGPGALNTSGVATFQTSDFTAGTHYAAAAYTSGDTNFVASPLSSPVQLVVAAKSVTAGITALNKVYDGTTAAIISGTTLTGVLAGDVGNVTLTVGAANFSDPNVGTAKIVTATGLALSGSAAANYVLASTTATTTADITAKDLTVTGSTENTINISKAGTLTFAISNVSGQVDGDTRTAYQLFNGATFTLQIGSNTYSVTSTASVDASTGTIYVTWRLSQELYNDLLAVLGTGTPSAKQLAELVVVGYSVDGNYIITADCMANIFSEGKVIWS